MRGLSNARCIQQSIEISAIVESERKASIAALEERLERLESWSIKDPESVQIELLSSEKLREIDLE
mgnify:FL=1